jgi:hypothetical protein
MLAAAEVDVIAELGAAAVRLDGHNLTCGSLAGGTRTHSPEAVNGIPRKRRRGRQQPETNCCVQHFIRGLPWQPLLTEIADLATEDR